MRQNRAPRAVLLRHAYRNASSVLTSDRSTERRFEIARYDEFAGKVVLATGPGSGIGRATAVAARTVIEDGRNEPVARELAWEHAPEVAVRAPVLKDRPSIEKGVAKAGLLEREPEVPEPHAVSHETYPDVSTREREAAGADSLLLSKEIRTSPLQWAGERGCGSRVQLLACDLADQQNVGVSWLFTLTADERTGNNARQRTLKSLSFCAGQLIWEQGGRGVESLCPRPTLSRSFRLPEYLLCCLPTTFCSSIHARRLRAARSGHDHCPFWSGSRLHDPCRDRSHNVVLDSEEAVRRARPARLLRERRIATCPHLMLLSR